MKKSLIIFTLFMSFLLLCSLLYFSYPPYIEAKTKTEYKSYSIGDCRIVNTATSIDNHLELRMYRYIDEPNKRHIIAIDDNRNIVDLSRLPADKLNQSLNGKELSVFENRKKEKPILEYIYTKEGQEIHSNIGLVTSSYQELIISLKAHAMIYYIKIFRTFYN